MTFWAILDVLRTIQAAIVLLDPLSEQIVTFCAIVGFQPTQAVLWPGSHFVI